MNLVFFVHTSIIFYACNLEVRDALLHLQVVAYDIKTMEFLVIP